MMAPPTAAMALASLNARDKLLVEQSFRHLTSNALQTLDRHMRNEFDDVLLDADGGKLEAQQIQSECHLAVAQACIRRVAYRCLDKYARLLSSLDVMEDALKHYTLPTEMQSELATKYSSSGTSTSSTTPPTTWYEALEQLKLMASTNDNDDAVLDQGKLWRLIVDHPMTSYVHVQCQKCGHTVPDQYPLQQSDAELGLEELQPVGDELELRAGWYRGPRKTVVFQLTCPKCKHISNWYRSGHPQIILNPNKWGRLCGEQEDLRLMLEDYLDIPVRLAVPLDWDHIWSEYKSSSGGWQVQDGSARNFCCRLDEGIGSWTRVWTIHTNPEWCQDVTQEYLAYQRDGGRADDRDHYGEDCARMKQYEQKVQAAQKDLSGELTQAKTCNGYVLARANLSSEEITQELQRAARDYGSKEWWQI